MDGKNRRIEKAEETKQWLIRKDYPVKLILIEIKRVGTLSRKKDFEKKNKKKKEIFVEV